VRVHLVDPAAYTPPYDRALASALARAGAEVELWTTAFRHGEVPPAPGVDVREAFYRRGGGRVARLAQHVPDMLRYARAARRADVVHFQWLPVQALDRFLLPRTRPRVLTAHDVLPREPKLGQLAGQKALYERMDAVVVHSEHGAGRLRELGIGNVHVIPHGAFDALAAVEGAPPLERRGGPVVLFFGLIRPYKGVDVLLDAWRRAEKPDGAELWVVGMPRMDTSFVRGPDVRTALRFVSGAELAGAFRAADVVVLPYREIDQSGVLFTALAFGAPMVLSAVGGFPEVAATGAAELVPPGDADALARALTGLLGDDDRRLRMAAAARAAAAGPYSWDAIARQTLALYSGLHA
jgi:glycosyltransferase involved in cell wall biosynthesis